MLYPKLHLKVKEQVCCTNKLVVVQARQVIAMASSVGRWGSGLITRLRLVWDLGLSWEAVMWWLVEFGLLVFFSLENVADLTRWIARKDFFFFCGIFSTFGWNWERIFWWLNPTHQHNHKIWGCISVVNPISDVRLPKPLYKFYLPNSTQLHIAQTLTPEDTGEGRQVK